MFNYLPMRFKVVFLMFIVSAKQGKKLLRKCFKSCHLSYSLSGFSQSTMCRLCTCLTVYRTSLSVQCADCVPVLPSLSVQCADCVPVLQFIGFLSVYNVQIVYTCLTVYRTSLSVQCADCVPVLPSLSVQCADCVPVLQFIGLLSVYNVQIVYLSYSLSDFSQCNIYRLCTCLSTSLQWRTLSLENRHSI